jgi:hypothetical protein
MPQIIMEKSKVISRFDQICLIYDQLIRHIYMKQLSCLALFIMCVSIIACTPDHIMPIKGNIVGNVMLLKQQGRILDDFSNIKVV